MYGESPTYVLHGFGSYPTDLDPIDFGCSRIVAPRSHWLLVVVAQAIALIDELCAVFPMKREPARDPARVGKGEGGTECCEGWRNIDDMTRYRWPLLTL